MFRKLNTKRKISIIVVLTVLVSLLFLEIGVRFFLRLDGGLLKGRWILYSRIIGELD
jgi:hypothetical protein